MSQVSELLTNRYGGIGPPGLEIPTTPVIEMLLQHKSVRKFLPDALPLGTLQALIAAGQSASTSSMLQTWSAIAIEDPEHKSAVAQLAGDQDFIRQAPLFLVFCADLNRQTNICEQHQQSGPGLEKMDPFIMATVDAALAAQSVAIAVESLGLGYCFVGAVRNNAREMAELLGLPPRTFALVGMSIGKVDKSELSDIKPRLPMDEVLHRGRWEAKTTRASFLLTIRRSVTSMPTTKSTAGSLGVTTWPVSHHLSSKMAGRICDGFWRIKILASNGTNYGEE